MRMITMVLLAMLFAPLAASAQDVRGNLDSVSGGWVLDLEHPKDQIGRVEVYLSDGRGNSYPPLVTSTMGLRPDVNNAFGVSGNHGFNVPIPELVKTNSEGSVVTATAYAVIGGNYYEFGTASTVYPFPMPGPKITARFRTASGLMPKDDSATTLQKMNASGGWDYVVASDTTSGNGRILNGSMLYWFRRVYFPTPAAGPVEEAFVSLECGTYRLIASATGGQIAYRIFPMCGQDVDLGTIILDTYPASVTIADQNITAQKISYIVMVNNQAKTKTEIYTVVNTPTPNSTGTTFVTNREDLAAGTSNLAYEVNMPKGVPDDFTVWLEVIVTEKNNPFNVLGRASFAMQTQKQ